MNRLISSRSINALLLASMAAAASHFLHQPAKAGSQIAPSQLIFRKWSSPFGMIPGQVARFCVGTADPNSPAVDWTVRILGERADLLLELPERHSPAGGWRCIDAARNSLGVPGDLGTGRAEVVASLALKAPRGTEASDIVTSLAVHEGTGETGHNVLLMDGSVKFLRTSIDVNVWALSNSQKLRISLSSQSSDTGKDITFTFAKVQIKTQGGVVILEKELQVPTNQFRLTEFTFEELVAAGLNPEPTGGIQFLIIVNSRSSRGETETAGSSQTITVGAAQSVNVGSGKTEMYNPFVTVDVPERAFLIPALRRPSSNSLAESFHPILRDHS